MKTAIVGTLLLFGIVLQALTQQQAEHECTQTSGMRIYSNATYVEEAGDVIGIELAFRVGRDNTVSALLFDYEGAPTAEGVPLPGRAEGTDVSIDGIWVQNLKGSSGEEIVRRTPVKLQGTVDEANFVGTVRIGGGKINDLRLRRVDAIWLCRANNKFIHAELE